MKAEELKSILEAIQFDKDVDKMHNVLELHSYHNARYPITNNSYATIYFDELFANEPKKEKYLKLFKDVFIAAHKKQDCPPHYSGGHLGEYYLIQGHATNYLKFCSCMMGL